MWSTTWRQLLRSSPRQNMISRLWCFQRYFPTKHSRSVLGDCAGSVCRTGYPELIQEWANSRVSIHDVSEPTNHKRRNRLSSNTWAHIVSDFVQSRSVRRTEPGWRVALANWIGYAKVGNYDRTDKHPKSTVEVYGIWRMICNETVMDSRSSRIDLISRLVSSRLWCGNGC